MNMSKLVYVRFISLFMPDEPTEDLLTEFSSSSSGDGSYLVTVS